MTQVTVSVLTLYASNVWVSFIAWLAGTDWPVPDNCTEGIAATLARILTLALHTGQVVSTLCVTDTNYLRWNCVLMESISYEA